MYNWPHILPAWCWCSLWLWARPRPRGQARRGRQPQPAVRGSKPPTGSTSTSTSTSTVTTAMCAPQQPWARHSSGDCILYCHSAVSMLATRRRPDLVFRGSIAAVSPLSTHLLLLEPWPVPVRPPEMQTLRVILCRCGRAVAVAGRRLCNPLACTKRDLPCSAAAASSTGTTCCRPPPLLPPTSAPQPQPGLIARPRSYRLQTSAPPCGQP